MLANIPVHIGKTHVSVLALKILLQNKLPDDPPIIIAAHTNHALDQLLRHVAKIEPDFIRLGGMTLDQDTVQARTLFKVKEATKIGPVPGGLRGPALANMRRLVKQMQQLLKPLTEGTAFSEDVFRAYGIVTETQAKLLVKGAANWVDTTLPALTTGAIPKWASDELVPAIRSTVPEDFGFDFEEVDVEFEQLRELEAEGRLNDNDDDLETLRGERIIFDEPLTGNDPQIGSGLSLDKLLATRDLWQVPPDLRGRLYRHMQQRVKEMMLQKFRQLALAYEKEALDLKIGKWEVDANYLQRANVIGCTTTGLSKYRALLSSLNPKIVLIEEAAETLEAYVTAACFDSLEHLILVGDHQQLRSQCNEKELEGYPWFLGVSMFERLVRNEVGFSQLTSQRRMHPEICRALMPIYKELKNHPSVMERKSVPGMSRVNSYFLTHEWHEKSDDLKSKINPEEANMVVSFFNYLVHNGMLTENITVLTFYNGQRKLILSKLRQHHNLQGAFFKVVTVDSYQGEENEIVLLSLVRSNSKGNIGFLSVANRVCVALSRAQRGFYIFGNAAMLCRESDLWYKVVLAMGMHPRRVGFFLPLTCTNHGKKTLVNRTSHIYNSYFFLLLQLTLVVDPSQFERNSGGCNKDCRVELSCGHICAHKCHP